MGKETLEDILLIVAMILCGIVFFNIREIAYELAIILAPVLNPILDFLNCIF